MSDEHFDNRLAEESNEDSHLSLEMLSAYLDGELDAGELSSASTHLSACELCQRELQILRATTILTRDLPEIRPAKSFQLGPEYADQGRVAVGTGWLSRMLGLMPALRTATAAVALLLVVVVAGDVLTNQNENNQAQELPAVTTNITSTASAQIAAPTETPADSLMIEAEAPTEPAGEGDNAAPAAGAAAPKESTEEESASQENTEEVSALQAEDSSNADESRAAEPERTSSPPLQPAAPAPTETAEPSPTPEPTATPQPTPTTVPSESSGTSEGRVSNWRIAEIALGLLLAWLIVTLVGLRRFRRG